MKANNPPEELRDFALWAAARNVCIAKDLTVLRLPTLADYRRATATRYECFRDWRDARHRFAQTHDWPGGEMERSMQELAVHPGVPFDPAVGLLTW
jgi:hypothetical protein